MQPRHRVSRTAIELIKRFEGYRQKAAQLPNGCWTIGHGHTLTARQGATVSQDDAEALLLYDLVGVSHALIEQVHAPLSQNQFDALASFAFNIGLDNFARSGVLKRLNEGSPILAACAMELWRKAMVGDERIVVDALVRRRAAEKALFLTPEDGTWVTAPSHVLQPLVDAQAFEVMPRETPAEVAAATTGETILLVREPAPIPVAPEDDETEPGMAAAEAVTARLATIFQTPEEEALAPPTPAASEGPAAAETFRLQPPEFDETEDAAPEPELAADTHIEGEPGRDLFDTRDGPPSAEPQPDPGALEELATEGPAWRGPAHDPEERRIIDDVAPYEEDLDLPIVQPMPDGPEGGALTLVALAVLGLVFFGGGVFWATNARPMPGAAVVDPRLVGWLAGVAGALFFAVAVYLLLQRLGRASEREARYRR